MLHRAALFLFSSLLAGAAHAEFGLPEPVGRGTYASPSGDYTLVVDPSSRFGSGTATYALRREGEIVWSGERPFTVQDAVVADDGAIGGYAYDEGDFVVAVIDPAGEVLTEERTPRVESNYLHVESDPKANGIFLQPALGQVVVRIDDPDVNANVETWWRFALADGKRLPSSVPRTRMTAGARLTLMNARALAGSPLTLVQWYRWNDPHRGAIYTLVDANDAPVWTLELPDDFAGIEAIWDVEAPFDTATPGRFALRHVAPNRRVEYSVVADGAASTGWTVAEAGRSPWKTVKPPTPADRIAAAPVVALEKLGTVVLDAPRAAPPPVQDVYDFAIDDRGRFGYLAGCACKTADPALVVIDADGALVRRVALPFDGERDTHAVWVTGERWLVTRSTRGEGATTRAAWVDVASGRVSDAAGFAAPQVDALAAMGEHGVVALATLRSKYTMEDRLLAFAPDGRTRWTIEDDGPDDPGLFSAEDVTVTSTGAIVVLENISHRIEVYGRAGSHEQSIELEQSWGRKPGYPSSIAADAAGGVVVHDFSGHPALVRMTLDGKVVQAFDPKRADGSRVETIADLNVAPDGRMWLSDGNVLMRLDADGVVDRTLGGGAAGPGLGDVATLVPSPSGGWLAVDARTGALHVFGADGALQRTCKPDAKDYEDGASDPRVDAQPDGSVFVSADKGRVHYAPDCTRVGLVAKKKDAPPSLPQPGTGRSWLLGMEVKLVDADGTLVRASDRAVDGEWLEYVNSSSARVAPDGSLALLTGFSNVRAVLFAADGAPIAAWPLPRGASAFDGRLAYDGRHVGVVVDEAATPHASHVVVTDARGEPLWRAPIRDVGHQSAKIWLTNGELIVFDGERTIERYALPE